MVFAESANLVNKDFSQYVKDNSMVLTLAKNDVLKENGICSEKEQTKYSFVRLGGITVFAGSSETTTQEMIGLMSTQTNDDGIVTTDIILPTTMNSDGKIIGRLNSAVANVGIARSSSYSDWYTQTQNNTTIHMQICFQSLGYGYVRPIGMSVYWSTTASGVTGNTIHAYYRNTGNLYALSGTGDLGLIQNDYTHTISSTISNPVVSQVYYNYGESMDSTRALYITGTYTSPGLGSLAEVYAQLSYTYNGASYSIVLADYYGYGG